ncbi:MAG TPA: ATP-binding protein [Candidatus Acidoferrum sp.]|nr:ATP-binding protein [Candidatus Acidoferrum sp.]
MNFRSISFRLVVWYTGLLTGIFLLLGVLFYFGLQHFVRTDMEHGQFHRARQIADTLLAHLPITGESALAGEIKTLYDPEINNRVIRLCRADGTVIYLSGRPADGSFNPAEVPAFYPHPAVDSSRKFNLTGGKTMLVVLVNYQAPNGDRYTVESGALMDPVEAMLNHLFIQLALCLPLAVLIIAGGGWLLVRRALQPVEQITRAAEQITQLNTSERMPVAQTGDELEKLSLSLNRMIARLDDALRNSTRFVADASHELRTPLTILQGELEMLAEDPQLPDDKRDRIFSILEEVSGLGKIVEQLFALSRLDAGESQTEWQSLDLAELARTTADQISLLAEDKHIVIACDARQPVLIEGDRARLKQVVVNLLDNAIKYTPDYGAVQLSVNALNGHAILEVSDNGIGIPPEALPHVFERFFRVNQSRSCDSFSAGLGLSIVKSICTAHGAEVQVQSTLRQGSCFRVKFTLEKN